MDLEQLLHPGVKQLLTQYDLTQNVSSIESDRIAFQTAELFAHMDHWYSLTIHNNKYTFTIDHIVDDRYILREFILNTESHRWDKINERVLKFIPEYTKLYH